MVNFLFDSSLELVLDSSLSLIHSPKVANDSCLGFFLLFLPLFELDPLNLHVLMVRPIFEEHHVPHQIDFLQALVYDFHLLVELGGHDIFIT